MGTAAPSPARGMGGPGAGFGGMGREFEFTDKDFRNIADRVRATAGIVLDDSKRDLVYGRIGRRLRACGCASFGEYLHRLNGEDGLDEQVALVNAITTNLTSFFREPHHFDTLSGQALPELARSRPPERRLRIWSAGCSSGEEPYTIAMVVQGSMPNLGQWDARILATDIDTDMIAACRNGIYDVEKVAPVPASLRNRFIEPVDEHTVSMGAALRELIRFRALNLLAPWPMKGLFDVIFCRNVVIYFDKPTQRVLFDRYADILKPGGWLFIGHSESLFRVSDRFKHLGRTIYRKVR